jgi:hypothetical protein
MTRFAAGILSGLIAMSIGGCHRGPPHGAAPPAAGEPREGFWDRENNRWWHEHSWHACDAHEPHCR